MAQGLSPFEAATLGCWLTGRAAEALAENSIGPLGLTAGEISQAARNVLNPLLKAAALLDAILRDDAAVAATVEAPRLRAGEGRRVLFVDCEDSFVQTLASYVRSTGAHVTTYRPGFPESLLDDLRPDLLFLSPGPKAPRDFDLSRIIGWAVARRLPIFGVCLGHQALGEHFGGALSVLPAPVHGKPTEIAHDGEGIFEGLPQGFTVARYHSLHVVESALPDEL